MPLTIEQKLLVIRHLEQKDAGTQCRICRQGKLKVHPEMECSPLAENKGEYQNLCPWYGVTGPGSIPGMLAHRAYSGWGDF